MHRLAELSPLEIIDRQLDHAIEHIFGKPRVDARRQEQQKIAAQIVNAASKTMITAMPAQSTVKVDIDL